MSSLAAAIWASEAALDLEWMGGRVVEEDEGGAWVERRRMEEERSVGWWVVMVRWREGISDGNILFIMMCLLGLMCQQLTTVHRR